MDVAVDKPGQQILPTAVNYIGCGGQTLRPPAKYILDAIFLDDNARILNWIRAGAID